MVSAEARTLGECAKIASDNNISTVACMFTDTWGIPRGKRLPLDQFLRGAGFSMAGVAFSWTPRSDILPTPWAEMDSEFRDMNLVPDLDSFRVAGWTEGLAVVMCDAIDPITHAAIPMDARGMVKKSLAEFAEAGYSVNMAPELEFHLFNEDWTPVSDQTLCYSMDRADELEAVIGGIREALLRSGINCEASNVEYGQSQVEINLRYGEALASLDETILFRHITKAVARKHGYHATFMVKPINGGAGSGMHIHQSLVDGSGENAFARADDPAHPVTSEVMRDYVAGLLTHQLELQAIAMPTLTSYKRAEDYSFAPTQVCWGLDNRLVGVRCLTGIGPGTRVEVRWGAADANPYLLAQGYLQAGLAGMREHYTLQNISSGDPHADTSLRRVALSLESAVDAFSASPFARRVYGDMFVDTYTKMQHDEMAAFAAHVTDWEFKRYADIF